MKQKFVFLQKTEIDQKMNRLLISVEYLDQSKDEFVPLPEASCIKWPPHTEANNRNLKIEFKKQYPTLVARLPKRTNSRGFTTRSALNIKVVKW